MINLSKALKFEIEKYFFLFFGFSWDYVLSLKIIFMIYKKRV